MLQQSIEQGRDASINHNFALVKMISADFECDSEGELSPEPNLIDKQLPYLNLPRSVTYSPFPIETRTVNRSSSDTAHRT